MTPTPKLRFVDRVVSINETTATKVRILQQWWEKKEWSYDTEIVVNSEWRDVPLEKEEEQA
jgi:hypothetical protein